MLRTILVAVAVLFVLTRGADRAPQTATTASAREGHAIWAHPPDVGKTAEATREFVAKCKRANIDTIVMDVKGMSGEIYWKSKKFPQAIARGYESFDVLENLVREAHAQGIKVDAWLVDFADGERGAAYREHPEWAMLNPDGTTTASESLGVAKRHYGYVWMCPARRPGYTDQWLLPMIEEIATNYAVDGIHHDYVRYPGDVSPEGYCFCDYCLKHIPRYAMLSYETGSTERLRVKRSQEHIEANWSDVTMIPADWEKRDRREKADYILNGRTIAGGPPDMRYFFYDYRAQQIDTFVREARERVQKINPKITISAAVFKNPVLSGRFIGQRWHEWSRWVDVFMPMSYRSFFGGSVDDYYDHLTEVTARQIEWTRGEKPLYQGIASTYLCREELQPLESMREQVSDLKNMPATDVTGRADKALAISHSFEALRGRLAQFAPDREREIASLLAPVVADGARAVSGEAIDKLTAVLLQLRRDLPPGFCPPERLTRSIEAARRAKPDGIVIFSAGNLTIEKLWPTLEAAFKR